MTSSSELKGWHVAFFLFAMAFVVAPMDKYLFSRWQWVAETGFPLARLMTLLLPGIVLFAVPALRSHCLNLLRVPISTGHLPEIATALTLQIVTAFAAVGIHALWVWNAGGDPALARWLGDGPSPAVQFHEAFSFKQMTLSLLIGGALAPFVEELIFRGMLYPAWAARWGWFRSAIVTSFIFAVFHFDGSVIAQFLGSLVFIGVFRRTGSLRAAIFVHAAFNILLWYPLLGRFLFPSVNTGELSNFTLPLVCLALTCIALPLYLWMSRNARAAVQA